MCVAKSNVRFAPNSDRATHFGCVGGKYPRLVGERTYTDRMKTPAHVRFGSKADICSAKRHVRFTSESGHVQCTSQCPLWAKSGHHVASRFTISRNPTGGGARNPRVDR